MKRVLLIKTSSLGDVVHALPAVQDASQHGYVFDWVVEESFSEIPALHPAVERVIPVAWRRWRKALRLHQSEMGDFLHKLRRHRYEWIIDSQGLIKSAVMTGLARGKRYGFAHTSAREPWAAFAYRQGIRIDKKQHAILRQRQLFAQALNYPLSERTNTGLESAAPKNRQVVLLHGTTWPTKHWPLEMWCELAKLVEESGLQPVLTWGNEAEQQRATTVAQAADVLLIPKTSLTDLARVLRGASLVIGVDSGLTHLSAALGAPTLGLYGPTSGLLTGCRGIHAQYLQSALSCAPCVRANCQDYRGEPLTWRDQVVEPACFSLLDPEHVWLHGKSLMASL